MVTHVASLALALDLVGILAFALSGGLLGVRKGLDIFGVLVLAGATGLGGGIIRDLLLDTQPVGVYDWRFVTTALTGGLLPFFFAQHVARLSRPIKVLDAAGLALFCVTAAVKAIGLGATPVACIIVGVITAIGGGIVRDLLAGVVPGVLRRELYAVPALVGSGIVVAADAAGALTTHTLWLAIVLTFGLRVISIRRRWEAPHPRTPLADPPRDQPRDHRNDPTGAS